MREVQELTDEQRRQLVDARQVFEAWQTLRATLRHRYAGSMRWVTRRGHDYLHRKIGSRERSLGRRSEETERASAAFFTGREETRAQLKQLAARLDTMAPVNRAHRLGRLPRISARILRKLDEIGLLGQHLLLVGTNALFAYEVAAGVHLQAGLLATADADLLWDARQRMALLLPEVRRQGVLEQIRRVDRSFRLRGPRDFRAFNKDGYWVDLIRPEDRSFLGSDSRDTVGEASDDLHGAPIRGLQWLINAPRFESVVIGADGYPVRLATVDPRAFALHKLWLSQRADRDPVKRQRDAAQAVAVAGLCRTYLGLSFAADDLKALPAALRDLHAAFPDEVPDRGNDMEPGW